MKLLWKLLRRNISKSQFFGFICANLFGLIIVLTGFQFYNDILPIFSSEDAFMKSNYITVTKRSNTNRGSFSEQEINDLQTLPFIKKVAPFTQTSYKAEAQMSIGGQQVLNSEIFLESIPDDFVDNDKEFREYQPGDKTVPIILPRTYINMYNFGYARTHSLPLISDGMLSMIDFNLHIKVDDGRDYKGRIVALSNSLSAVLVPQKFMDWSNQTFTTEKSEKPIRLLMEVTDPTDKNLSEYFEDKGLELESDKLNTEKTLHFLRLTISIVVAIGLFVCILSFYILILSIYLLVQKNTEKLQNLLLIGYSQSKVAMPYQLLAFTLNTIVLVLGIIATSIIRGLYINELKALSDNVISSINTFLPTILLGIVLTISISLINIVIIRKKISKIQS